MTETEQAPLPVINTAELSWGVAKKTKPIRVKPINTILADETVAHKFLLATLEGSQMLKANSMVCIGDDDDAWQQTAEKLHKQYTPEAVDADGWTTFVPKPEAVRDWAQICFSDEFQEAHGTKFALIAQWGERQSDGSFLQYGEHGDYILRSADPDHGADSSELWDCWIVARKIFEATYEKQKEESEEGS